MAGVGEMARRCSNEDCTFVETGSCARKVADAELNCPDLATGLATVETIATTDSSTDAADAPDVAVPTSRFWSGLALGGEDAGRLLMDPSTRLITVIGGEDRGK